MTNEERRAVDRHRALAIVAEIADALAPYGAMPCAPMIEEEDGQWTLRLTFVPRSDEEALRLLELTAALRRVQDVAQIRGFCERYGIPSAQLDILITGESTTSVEALSRAGA